MASTFLQKCWEERQIAALIAIKNHNEIKSFLERFYIKEILGTNGRNAYPGQQEVVGIDHQRVGIDHQRTKRKTIICIIKVR